MSAERRGGGGERRGMDRWIDRGGRGGGRGGGTLILLCHDLGGFLSFYGNKIETNSAEGCVGICF